MIVDYTITIGNIVEIVSIVAGGFAALITLRVTVNNIKNDMTDMKAELKKVGEVLIKMAVHSMRLDNIEQDVRDLKHGRGFIQPRADGGINGEWP